LDPYILLDDRKAYTVDMSGFSPLRRKGADQQMWILIDSQAFPDGIPPEFLFHHGPRSMLVYSSSPQLSRWGKVEQYNMHITTIVMNPWSKWEAELL
jgi:hypothetical protein